MSKFGKLVLIVCGLALVSKACSVADGEANAKSTSDAKVVGMTVVTHTDQAEQHYKLPSWNWTQAEIYSYDNGWNKVCFYVEGREEPVEQNWYPQ